MSSEDLCFGLFGIEDDDKSKAEDQKEVVNLPADIELCSKICCVCSSEDIKYRCPGCGLRSCSLLCVKEHKDVFECDGKRIKTTFVKMENFDQATFMSDYFLLEEADNVVEKASRMRRNIVQSRQELPSWLQKIRYEARVRGTRLKILPAGFEKRKRNKTMFYFKEKCLLWTMELEFELVRPFKVSLDRVNENRTLKDVINELMKPNDVLGNCDQVLNLQQLKEIGLENLIVFLQVDGRKTYWKIDSNDTISKSLEGKTIVEYPKFIVTTKCKELDYPIMTNLTSESLINTDEKEEPSN